MFLIHALTSEQKLTLESFSKRFSLISAKSRLRLCWSDQFQLDLTANWAAAGVFVAQITSSWYSAPTTFKIADN